MNHAQEEAATTVKQDSADEPQADTTAETKAHADTTSASTTATAEPAQPSPRLQSLQKKHATLTTTLATLQADRAALVAQATLPSGLAMPDAWSDKEKSKHALAGANAVIKDHIRLLHEYNEIKDIGQGLMGMVAEGRGVRIREVMEDFGMGEKD